MNILGSFIGIHREQVHQVANNMILVQDSVRPEHVSRCDGYLQRFLGTTALDQTNRLVGAFAFV